MNCPHCHVRMIDHGDANPHKAGAHHCNTCGCCLLADGSIREGHAPCRNYVAPKVRARPVEAVPPAESPRPPEAPEVAGLESARAEGSEELTAPASPGGEETAPEAAPDPDPAANAEAAPETAPQAEPEPVPAAKRGKGA
jgi:hypothetical protein